MGALWFGAGNTERPNEAQSLSGNWIEHLQSVGNFTNHPSNQERLNRWKCAWRMFLEKPVLGWGPGTYQFQYGAFQKKEEMTRISTQEGDRGNAHSEYLGSLAEGGILLILTQCLFFGLILIRMIKFIHIDQEADRRFLVAALLAGILSFVLHGMVNTFSDQIQMWLFCSSLSLSFRVFHLPKRLKLKLSEYSVTFFWTFRLQYGSFTGIYSACDKININKRSQF